MPMTVQERTQKAGRASALAARRRRFERFAGELAAHPEEITDVAAHKLAEALHERGGWRVFEDH